jgi:hypothetical protein
MWKVDIYLETDSTFQGKKHRRCGYVLATQLRTGEKTKGGFGYTEGTYHQAILKTLAEAFFRMNKPARSAFIRRTHMSIADFSSWMRWQMQDGVTQKEN